MTNLSAGGARIRTLDQTKSAMQPSDNAPTSLLIERYGRLRSKLMWTEGDNVGVRFLHNPKAVRTFLGPSLAGNSAAAAA